MPDRITLSRARGWRMPESTVKVDRTTRWGNPFDLRAVLDELDLAKGVIRMCVNCARTRPASEGRETPGEGCPSPDACTWDMTPQEAIHHQRLRAANLRHGLSNLYDAIPAEPATEDDPAFQDAMAARVLGR